MEGISPTRPPADFDFNLHNVLDILSSIARCTIHLFVSILSNTRLCISGLCFFPSNWTLRPLLEQAPNFVTPLLQLALGGP